jgi:hypothetical protein
MENLVVFLAILRPAQLSSLRTTKIIQLFQDGDRNKAHFEVAIQSGLKLKIFKRTIGERDIVR